MIYVNQIYSIGTYILDTNTVITRGTKLHNLHAAKQLDSGGVVYISWSEESYGMYVVVLVRLVL